MADITYVTIPNMTAATDAQVIDTTLVEAAVVDANEDSGYASRKMTVAQLKSHINDDLKSDIGELSNLDTTDKSSIVSAINEVAQGGGGSLTQDTKQALLQCFAHTAWTDAHGQTYYDDLEDALYPFDLLSSISAVYTQSGTVYDTDSLDSLKADLVVTGNYSDGTYNTTTKYTLSGTLTVGTSTITVTYGGKTASFTVNVTQSAAVLTSISAVYTQSGTVYDTDSLDSLKTDLVVTAHYSDSSTATVPSTDYTLSGTLTVGTSTVTVSYGGKTTTFTVTVSLDREAIFGTFINGHAISKAAGAVGDIPKNGTYIASTSARAAFSTPIANANYTFTVTDSSKYNIAVYDITDNTPISTTYNSAIEHVYYTGGTKAISWKATDSASTPYILVALKKMNNTAFSNDELANGAEAVFAYTTA